MADQERPSEPPPRIPAVQRARETLRVLEAEGAPSETLVRYEKLLQHEDAPVDVSFQLGLLYQRLGRYPQALARFEACFHSADHGVAALVASGECELDLGRPARATPFFDRALRQLLVSPDAAPADTVRVLRVAAESAERQGDAELHARYSARLAVAEAATSPFDDGALPQAADDRGTTQVETASAGGEPASGDRGLPQRPLQARAVPAGPGTGRLHTTYKRVFSTEHASETAPQPATAQPVVVASRWQPRAGGTSAFRTQHGFRRGRVQLQQYAVLPEEDQLGAAPRALLARAAADLRDNHPVAALDSCQALIAAAPDFLSAHLRLAEAYAKNGQLSEALNTCQTLLRLYETRRESARAIPIYRLIGALSPDDLTAWTTMADHYFAQGGDPSYRADVAAFILRAARLDHPEVALEYAERLAASAHDDAVARRLAAELQLRRGTPARALPHYQMLLHRDPNDLQAVAGAHIALTLRDGTPHWPSLERLVQYLPAAGGDERQATVALFSQAMASTAASGPHWHCARGVLALALQDTVAARDAFSTAHERASAGTDPTVQFVIACGLQRTMSALDAGAAERVWIPRTLELLRDPKVRAFAAQSALFGGPVTPSALQIALAESYLLDGHDTEAIAVLARARADFPEDANVPRRLAALQTLQGNIGGALEELDALARRQLEHGQLEAMRETMGQMSSLAGDSVAVKNRVVGLYAARGFPREALRELERIVTIYERAGRLSEAADTLRRCAELAEMIGAPDEAGDCYLRALRLAPTDTALRQAYVNVLLRSGRRADAVEQQRIIARALGEASDLTGAIAAFHQVLVLDPGDVESHHGLADALSAAGEYGEAERVYRRLVRLAPDDPVAAEKQAAMAALANA